MGQIQNELSKFSPDWISLQFVPYSFHSKGWCWQLEKFLDIIAPIKCKWQIMFHEIWIGAH
ncbi:MAG TPA: hypothetical protein PLV25_06515, partial [Opitutales bacterium]|nr:hypothetical protein [Opitutales bacterium]